MSIKSQISAILAAVLGVLALLLGFTFSLALQRYDSRSETVVDEANAIGTAYLRAQLLPAGIRDQVGVMLSDYLDVRIQAGGVSLTDSTAREPLLRRTRQLSDELWRYARQAAEQDARPVTSGLFIQSLNNLIDAYGKRDAALSRHVPEVVLYLVFVTFLMAGSILGYAAGIEGTRATFPTVMMAALIVLLVFLIIDLDRPRRGIIQVSQKSLVDLQQTIANTRVPVALRDSSPGASTAARR